MDTSFIATLFIYQWYELGTMQKIPWQNVDLIKHEK